MHLADVHQGEATFLHKSTLTSIALPVCHGGAATVDEIVVLHGPEGHNLG
jgi:hypothetical protein